MDAPGYLKRHGWRGDGHSLDSGGRGIRKPLLVSKKIDVLGLGVNKHAAVSDQWWMRAFDQGLKDLGTGKESALTGVQKHGIHHGGLYGRFVKGEGVPGTIDEETVVTTTSDATEPSRNARLSEANPKADEAAVLAKKLDRSERKKDKGTKAERKLEKAERRHAKAEKAVKTGFQDLSAATKGKLRRKLDQARLKLKKAKRDMEQLERKKGKARRQEGITKAKSKHDPKSKREKKLKYDKKLKREKRSKEIKEIG